MGVDLKCCNILWGFFFFELVFSALVLCQICEKGEMPGRQREIVCLVCMRGEEAPATVVNN